MKKAAVILIVCIVLQIAQSAVLTLAVLCVALYVGVGRFLIEAGRKGLL